MKRSQTVALLVAGAALVAGIAVAPSVRAQAVPRRAERPIVSAEKVAKYSDASLETARANVSLARLASRYRYLDSVTVTVGSTPDGRQAVSYYTRGVIVIDRNHEYSIDVILEHEIWHVVDWRDNGRLDWGEDVPPSDAASYER